jgi:hypothetical protein
MFWALVAVSAFLGMASNSIRAQWGLLLLPAEVCAIAAAFLLPAFVSAHEPWSLKDFVNALLWMLFPVLVFTAPPFLVGRYVPQAVRVVRRRKEV